MNTLFENTKRMRENLGGKIPLVLLWLVGIPMPILIIIFLFRGCSS